MWLTEILCLGIIPNLLDIPREDMGKSMIQMGAPSKGKRKKGTNFITAHVNEVTAEEREAKWHELLDP